VNQDPVQSVEHQIAIGEARQHVVGGDMLQVHLGLLELVDLAR